jgi:uncharacterized protein (DUF2164 family)
MTLNSARRSATCCATGSASTAKTFDLELEQFDAEFFVDFIAKELGPLFYNAGIEEAIRTHLAWSERIQEEMDLKKVY